MKKRKGFSQSSFEPGSELFNGIEIWRIWREKAIIPILAQPEEALVLDVGARNGGTSLFFAMNGMNCVCSDLNGPSAEARELHERYGVTPRIKYASVDCTNIPYADESFDIVSFKSVLGGIGSNNNFSAVEQAMGEIYRVMKPGGMLLFAENLQGSKLHQFFRSKFVRWGEYGGTDLTVAAARFDTRRRENFTLQGGQI